MADSTVPSSSAPVDSDDQSIDGLLEEGELPDDGWEMGEYITPQVRLVKPLAEGGMGTVWIAEHESLERQVAVKLVATQLLKRRPSVGKRFDREAATLAQLRHPNVVEIFDHGTTSRGNPYIVMELLAGRTLRRRIKQGGPMPLGDVSTVLRQVGDALRAAHERGIIHRDIKPENIFLVDEDPLVAKLLDFGIAKQTDVPAISAVTVTGMMIGTPHFMSPEQLLEPKTLDFRTDLWSLGVVAYVAMTGKRPFRGDTLAKLFDAITRKKIPKPSRRRPELPASVDAWFERAVAREVKERFRTAHEMASAFERAIHGGERRSTLPPTMPAFSLDDDLPRAKGPQEASGDPLAGILMPPEEAADGGPSSADSGSFPGASEGSFPGVKPSTMPSRPPSTGSRPPAETPERKGSHDLVPYPLALGTPSANPRYGAGPSSGAAGGFEVGGIHISNRLIGGVVVLVVAGAGALAGLRWWRYQKARAVPATMKSVPAGSFTMGCSGDAQCEPDELPAHEVGLSAFHLDETEVTVQRYRACVEAGVCNQNGFDAAACTWGRADDLLPINCVSFAQAQRFCEWTGARLPTEAEWERAARGDDGRRYPWGNDEASCVNAVVAEGARRACSRQGPEPVATVGQSGPYGHHDLAGNVWEWTADWYGPSFYSESSTTNPRGPAGGGERVVRGGGWMAGDPSSVRTTHREGAEPDTHSPTTGFRCARNGVQ